MFTLTKIKKATLAIVVASATVISGCGSDSNGGSSTVVSVPTVPDPVVYDYEVKVTNLTNAQPMSPVVAILHNEGNVWQAGEEASIPLETLAESGDSSGIIAESYVLSSASGAGMLMPGMEETFMLSITDVNPMKVSVATMLVNTNDAFTGVNALSIENLAAGESISLQTSSYDSGTEKNSETALTIPGPAGGGEGFNAERDDINRVIMHSGVVSQDDGLTQSALMQEHRFDNPTMHVVITRIN